MIRTKKIEIDEYDTPWEVACKLINAMHKVKVKPMFGGAEHEVDRPVFSIDDLYLMGDHLMKYAIAEGYKESERNNEYSD